MSFCGGKKFHQEQFLARRDHIFVLKGRLIIRFSGSFFSSKASQRGLVAQKVCRSWDKFGKYPASPIGFVILAS